MKLKPIQTPTRNKNTLTHEKKYDHHPLEGAKISSFMFMIFADDIREHYTIKKNLSNIKN